MQIDTDKIDEAVLALLHLTRCDEKFGAAAWKSHDWQLPDWDGPGLVRTLIDPLKNLR